MKTDIIRQLGRALTVAQLIEELQQYPEEALVVFASDYGDHCHTTQALLVTSVEQTYSTCIYDTAYSDSGLAIREDSDSEDGEEDEEKVDEKEVVEVIVLR